MTQLLLRSGTKRRWSLFAEAKALDMLAISGVADSMDTIVYALSDVETHEVRYVGCCANGLGYRLTRHIYFAEKGKPWGVSEWLRTVGYRVQVSVLAVNPADPRAVELEFIHRLRADGARLTNYVGGPTSAEQKQAATEANHRRWSDPAKRAELADRNRRGVTGFKGRVHTSETRERIGASSRGTTRPPVTAETRRRMSEAAKRRCARGKGVMPC